MSHVELARGENFQFQGFPEHAAEAQWYEPLDLNCEKPDILTCVSNGCK